MFLVCQNDSSRILPQFGSVKFFYIIKSMKLTKLGCYLLVFRANLRAFSYIFTSNNINNDHMCVWKSHLEPRKKLIFLPQNQPWRGYFVSSKKMLPMHCYACPGNNNATIFYPGFCKNLLKKVTQLSTVLWDTVATECLFLISIAY